MKFFGLVAPDLGIDLGTANTLVYKENAGIIIDEPSVVAIDVKTSEVVAVGKEAKNMIGKTPDHILVAKPLEGGVISDFDLTQMMLSYFIKNATPGFALLQPLVVISVPSGVTDVERRAVEDAALHAGARDVYLLEESLASALGAGIPVEEPVGSMIINIGAGTSEVSVISLDGVVASKSVGYGGDHLDSLIYEMIKSKYSLIIGDNLAEEIKKEYATYGFPGSNTYVEVSGRDVTTGMPRTETVYVADIANVIRPTGVDLMDRVRAALEKTPPDLATDIVRNGIVMTGGGSLTKGLREYVEESISIPVTIAEDPLLCTVRGTGKAVLKAREYRKMRKR